MHTFIRATISFFLLNYSLIHATKPSNITNPQKSNSQDIISKKLSDAKFFNDLFIYEIAIPLEQNSLALFDSPTLALISENGYFIADDNGKMIYRYHLDGSFDRIVARRGQGPGEISNVSFGTRIFDNHLAFYDLHKKQIKVFSSNGDFTQEVNLERKNNGTTSILTIGEAFAWPVPNQIIFSNTYVHNRPEAQSALFQVSWNQKSEISGVSFDRVLSHRNVAHEKKFGTSNIYTLAKVGEKYWLGSPEFSQFTILDPRKHHISTPTKVQLSDALTPALYEDVSVSDTETLFRLVNMNGTIHDILPLGKIVLVKVGARGYVPFDQDGQQLLERRLLLKWANVRDAHQDMILTITDHRKATALAKQAGEPLSEPPGNVEVDDDYPYLVLMRLKPEFR